MNCDSKRKACFLLIFNPILFSFIVIIIIRCCPMPIQPFALVSSTIEIFSSNPSTFPTVQTQIVVILSSSNCQLCLCHCQTVCTRRGGYGFTFFAVSSLYIAFSLRRSINLAVSFSRPPSPGYHTTGVSSHSATTARARKTRRPQLRWDRLSL